MISAKRNKEGEIIVSGLEVTKYYYFDFAQNGNALIVSRAENRFTIPIEDEKETEPKFIPTYEELLQWGFVEINAKTIWRKVIGEVYFYYQPEINELEKLIGSMNYGYIPFHTKQDFMRAVGVSNIEELIANHDKKELIKKTLQAVCYLSDEVLEMTVNNIINILSREK